MSQRAIARTSSIFHVQEAAMLHQRVHLRAIAASIGSLLVSFSIHAQTLPPPLTVPPATKFPNEIVDRVNAHLNKAREIAGDDLYPHFMRRCVLSQIYSQYANSAEDPLQMDPIQVFDNLYFIGQGAVSAWAVKTSAGLVIIDSLNNPSEAEYILVAGLKKLGFSPSDMKYLLITHEHGDHYGGARYLQDTYGVQLVSSDIAWKAMDNGSATRPRRNITVADGQTWTVGDTDFLFTVTPGHTPGALSTIIPVFDHGTKHLGAIFGGFGIPGSLDNKVLQINSIERFAAIAKRAGVDTLLANHQTQDLSLYNHDLLRHRRLKTAFDHRSGQSGYGNDLGAEDFRDPHPYVVSDLNYERYLQLQAECVRVSAARNGQVLPDAVEQLMLVLINTGR
jgi:metallo-beta-lactamase class B